ncbi:MAG TPA: CbtB-domain containing protein [Stellaceae bacterium]|nr:CbtB-domain containing protein [Stellaceae bacterium]
MQLEAVTVQARAEGQTAARAEAVPAAAMAALLGALVLWGVGFSPIAALHNAAHDTRHSMAFPCH